jgi:ABC-type dipeptide/oligopeptide/nickel transport system permease component
MLLVALFLLLNLLVDIVYALIDPRIRSSLGAYAVRGGAGAA